METVKEMIKEKLSKVKNLTSKAISLGVLVLLGLASYRVAQIGLAEMQTFYYHILFVLLWLLTAGIGMKVYSIWSLSRNASEGDDGELNQEERGKLLMVHSAIVIAAAILVFGTIIIYFGKKSDEVVSVNSGDVACRITDISTEPLHNTLQ